MKFGKIKETWFDGLDIPNPGNTGKFPRTCHDIHHFEAPEDGVMFNLTLSVRGLFNKNTMDFQLHFIRREGETYIIDQQLKTSFLAKLKKLYFDTPGGGATNEELDTYADNLFRGEYFFMTDYDTYFVMGFCTPIGLKGFSHFRTITPTAKAIYNMWNVFASHNQVTSIGWEDMCFAWQ
ncbi:uncharacterized protein LOC144411822 [Styela clava]